MERRALVILLVTLTLVVGVFWWATPRDDKPRQKETIVFPPGVDVQGQDLVLLRSGPGGEMQVRAERGYGVRESNEAVLENVTIRLRAQDGREGTLRAERCVVPSEGNTVDLEGPVVASADGFDLETTDVEFDWTEHIARTDSPVHVKGPGLTMSGTGADVEWAQQRITIRENVVATVMPSQLPSDVQRALPGMGVSP